MPGRWLCFEKLCTEALISKGWLINQGSLNYFIMSAVHRYTHSHMSYLDSQSMLVLWRYCFSHTLSPNPPKQFRTIIALTPVFSTMSSAFCSYFTISSHQYKWGPAFFPKLCSKKKPTVCDTHCSSWQGSSRGRDLCWALRRCGVGHCLRDQVRAGGGCRGAPHKYLS